MRENGDQISHCAHRFPETKLIFQKKSDFRDSMMHKVNYEKETKNVTQRRISIREYLLKNLVSYQTC